MHRLAHPYWALIHFFLSVEHEHISCWEECVSSLQLLRGLPCALWPPTSALLKQRWDWMLCNSPKVNQIRFIVVLTFINMSEMFFWTLKKPHVLKVSKFKVKSKFKGLLNAKFTESSLDERITFTLKSRVEMIARETLCRY